MNESSGAPDDVLGEYSAWQQKDYEEAIKGIQAGYEDIQAGRMSSVDEVFDRLCVKHGLPR